jgi:hypothetical protein
MEMLESTYTTATMMLLAVLLVALLVVRLITPLERQLVCSAALILAGLFYLARSAHDPTVAVVGGVGWTIGLVSFIDAALRWTSSAVSRFGVLALPFLLPPAFFGAVLVDGLIVSLLS